MPVVIEELSAEITPDPHESPAQPAEDAAERAVLDLIELATERETRLAVD